MMDKSILVKIGGRILENTENLKFTLDQLKFLYKKNIVQKIIIIPGGGAFANFIRIVDEKFKLGDDLAHFMAIYAMDYNGKNIHKTYSELQLSNNLTEVKQFERSLIIFLPYHYLKEIDELPHNWNVTSDSISAYIAHKLGITQIFLIKDIDGIYLESENSVIKKISPKEYNMLKRNHKLASFHLNAPNIKESSPLDSYILNLLYTYHISCIILNGSPPDSKIIDFFDENKPEQEKKYTEIVS